MLTFTFYFTTSQFMAQFKTKILCFWINLLAKKEIKHMLNYCIYVIYN